MTTARCLLALALAGAVLMPGCRPEPAPVAAPDGQRLYQCPMHPQIVRREPGTCPICGMELVPVDPHAGHAERTAPDGAPVAGRAPITLDAARQQLIGVRRGRVEHRELVRDVRAFGRVAYDPELYGAIVEYREALAARRQLARSPLHEAGRGADAVVRAAALKLRQKGITESQLARLGRDPVNLLLPDETVWLYLQVYEFELPLVRPGQEVRVSVPTNPAQAWVARVESVDPVLDPATRTARVRVLVETPARDLRPETYVSAHIRVPLGRVLAVPKEAVLDTGTERIVFVVDAAGTFHPRTVALGREAEDGWEVLDGLAEGDEVVTSANFLIDSESRFRAAREAFGGEAPAAGHQH